MAANFTGKGHTVVVVDSGAGTYYHESNVIYDHDFADGDDDGRDPRIFSHGAQVADVVTDTAVDAQIIHLKVFEDFASGGKLADVEAALQWVIANANAYDVAAVNLSIGYGDVNQPTQTQLSDELSAIKAAGIVTVVSSGNDDRENTADGINVLAANDDVIAVGALDRAETARAAWSQHGDLLDVYAPGEDVMVDMPWFYSGERAVSGTSFAAPKVAGAVAIVQEAAISEYGQALSPSQFEYLLSVSAHDAVECAPVVDIDAMVASLQDGYAFMA